MPEISVIIPCYNVEKYVGQCLDSVINQTFADFEIICVNDGSTDNTLSILQDYVAKDSRMKVITQENQGLSCARNNGLKEAKGNYIYFLDSDDEIHTQCLEIAHTFATKYDADLVCWHYQENRGVETLQGNFEITNIPHKISDNPVMLGTNKEKYCVNYNVWTKLYKKSLLEGIEFIPHIHFEDYPHTFAVIAKRPKTVVLDARFYLYRINQESISHQSGSVQQIRDYKTGINYVLDIYCKKELEKELAFLKRNFIPIILKHQLGRCRRADKSVQNKMFAEFAKELRDLQAKNMLSWRDHKLTRYFAYKKIMKEF